MTVLAEKQSPPREAYHADRTSRDVVERRFVKATEAALDIAETVVAAELDVHPESNPETMLRLVEADVLSEEAADVARFRNALAHTYGGVIDDGIVYDALQDLERCRTFLVEVRDRLDAEGSLS